MMMRERHLTCLGPHGFFRVAYTEWAGPAGAPAVVCVHGLTRNGRDFDALAAALSATHRVVCPDMPGRGKSEWLAQPEAYGYPLYLSVAAALIARLDVEEVDWVGTSMGGLIGMMLAAQPGAPFRRLVINDIGPFLPKAALERIGSYVGQDPRFENVEALEAYLRRVHAPFGPLSDAEWRHLAEHSARRRGDNGVALAYDPRIGDAFKGELADVELWNFWDRLSVPTLVLRGSESDLLRPETAARMAESARVVEIAGVGHAPALMAQDQIGMIRDFLAGAD
jgi:pimeloyl-ACP methyl ester carboxylesterase